MRKAVLARTSRTASLAVASLALLAGTLGLMPTGPFRALEASPAATYKLSAPPVASFRWFPSSPRVGEKFSLVSTSSDPTSPIVAFAWDTSDNGPFGPFQPGGPTTSALFSTPADHVVRLRVTAADHLSSVAAATIHMGAPPQGVLQPFPTVRIVGRLVRGGIRLSILSVKAPAKARIKVNCSGHGCPVRAQRRTASLPRAPPPPSRRRPFCGSRRLPMLVKRCRWRRPRPTAAVPSHHRRGIYWEAGPSTTAALSRKRRSAPRGSISCACLSTRPTAAGMSPLR